MASGLCIIGSGYSAAALLLHLDAQGAELDNTTVVGPERLGAGQAFGCVNGDFRLNVRADLMQLWPDDPNHFARWASIHVADDPDAATPIGPFHRRRDFASYVAQELAARPGVSAVRHIQNTAVALVSSKNEWEVTLADGSTVKAGQVVLATGNPPPRWPFQKQIADSSTLIRVPWRGDWHQQVTQQARVVIIGSGLTALDAVHTLRLHGHKGAIRLVAPDGLLPPVQTDWQDADPLVWPETPSAAKFLRFMRDVTGDDIRWEETEWQRRFESLRVNVSSAWQTLPATEQSRLMRRFGWLWSLTRFRAGPQAHGSAMALLESGQLEMITDMVTAIDTNNDRSHLVRLAGGDSLAADAVVNCSGAGRDPLVCRLLEDDVAMPHETFAGRPALSPDMALLRADGTAHDNLFGVGPMTAHVAGDVLGSASIARQARRLATHLMG
ncbi:MAG: FAD/NAD(P)-binding protein [Candidatus Puniceispirillaceae bacterium]